MTWTIHDGRNSIWYAEYQRDVDGTLERFCLLGAGHSWDEALAGMLEYLAVCVEFGVMDEQVAVEVYGGLRCKYANPGSAAIFEGNFYGEYNNPMLLFHKEQPNKWQSIARARERANRYQVKPA